MKLDVLFFPLPPSFAREGGFRRGTAAPLYLFTLINITAIHHFTFQTSLVAGVYAEHVDGPTLMSRYEY